VHVVHAKDTPAEPAPFIADCSMQAIPARQITSINFADAFAHSLLGITDRIKNVSHVLVEALVTQGPTPGSYRR